MRNLIFLEDCLEGMKRIPDGSVDMILCDLPYGTTQNKWDSVLPFELLWREYERVTKPNAAIVLTGAQPFTSALVMSNPALFRYEWMWDKRRPTGQLNSRRQPLRQHENILVFYGRQPTYNPQMHSNRLPRDFHGPVRKSVKQSENYGQQADYNSAIDANAKSWPRSIISQTTVIGNSREKAPHPTQKPVKLFRYLIRTYTNPGDLVLDNCMGSGTTAIACLQEGRYYIGFETNALYYKNSLERIAQYTQQS